LCAVCSAGGASAGLERSGGITKGDQIGPQRGQAEEIAKNFRQFHGPWTITETSHSEAKRLDHITTLLPSIMFGNLKGHRRLPFQRFYAFLALLATTFPKKNHVVHGLNNSLLRRAASVRERLNIMPDSDDLYFPSAYERSSTGNMRGFCNWIIPNRVMVGQYPGQNPEVDGPDQEAVQAHIESMIQDACITMFCSLQSEIPSQDDSSAWEDGGIYLEPMGRRDFPRPFTHYAPIIRSLSPDCRFLHAPIVDLSVPNSDSLQSLLLQLLEAIDEEDRSIYIHCWGGRGRAGLVGSCLVSLLWPELDSNAVLDLVQAGYDTRAGAKEMPLSLSKSPQTSTQREFVKAFVQERQRHHKQR
jgi:hypothetical protein